MDGLGEVVPFLPDRGVGVVGGHGAAEGDDEPDSFQGREGQMFSGEDGVVCLDGEEGDAAVGECGGEVVSQDLNGVVGG